MANISVAGIGSNIDVQGIVDKLMNAEQRPLVLLQKKEASYQSKISGYGALKGALNDLYTQITALKSSTLYNTYQANVSDSSVLSVSLQEGASLGASSIDIQQLAQQHKVAASGVANTTTALGSGSMTITLGAYDSIGNSFTPNTAKLPISITIDSSNNTLAGIKTAINNSNSGVIAQIVNDGTTGERLVFTSTETGTVNSMQITTQDDDGNNTDNLGLSMFSYDQTLVAGSGKNMEEIQKAQNALLKVDGLNISSTSNQNSGIISGVTLYFKAVGKTNLDVKEITQPLTDTLNAFVNSYNQTESLIKRMTGAGQNGFQGDFTINSIQNKMRGGTSEFVSNTSSINTFSELGISRQKDGTLSFDSSKFQKVLASDKAGVQNFLTTIATHMDIQMSQILGNTGILEQRISGTETSIKGVQKQQDLIKTRLERVRTQYMQQFINLDTILSSLSKTSSYLQQNLPSNF